MPRVVVAGRGGSGCGGVGAGIVVRWWRSPLSDGAGQDGDRQDPQLQQPASGGDVGITTITTTTTTSRNSSSSSSTTTTITSNNTSTAVLLATARKSRQSLPGRFFFRRVARLMFTLSPIVLSSIVKTFNGNIWKVSRCRPHLSCRAVYASSRMSNPTFLSAIPFEETYIFSSFKKSVAGQL